MDRYSSDPCSCHLYQWMSGPEVPSKKATLVRVAHTMAGLLVAFGAFERFGQGSPNALYFTGAAIVFLCMALFHHHVLIRFPWADAVIILVEAMLSFIIMFEFRAQGKNGLPYMYLLAGLVQMVGMVLLFKKAQRKASSE